MLKRHLIQLKYLTYLLTLKTQDLKDLHSVNWFTFVEKLTMLHLKRLVVLVLMVAYNQLFDENPALAQRFKPMWQEI